MLLRCLSYHEADYVLREVHEGCCGKHLGAYALARKVMLVGYCWPLVMHAAQEFVMSCDSCQHHAPLHHRPAALMKTITAACPWGIDIVRSFPIAPAQKNFISVAVDYFSKWVEAEPLARVIENDVLKFFWKNIVCRYGVPRRLISYNGRQFQGAKIQAWCKEMNIQQVFTSIVYPQSNGHVEVTNRTPVQGLKVRLVKAKGN
ncbi:uncharacterized protein [Primulina eburnea]|uniref:uncharacterized protein n=1 Tax=Primulina eburnea TaxID=1245227 RepID=UPI003C6C6CF9